MTSNEIKVLKTLCDLFPPNQIITIKFNALAKYMSLSKEDLDVALNQLNNKHYISEFVMSNDLSILKISQLGCELADAALDAG